MSASAKPGFFGAIINPQSYLNIVYLLLAFPLGIFYFIFLVTGLSLGAGLFITLAGIPVLLFVLAGATFLCKFERILAIKLLKANIPNLPERIVSPGLWSRIKRMLSDRLTWTGISYLLFKFPIGIATFTVTVVLLAVSIGFVFAPAYMWTSNPLTWGDWVLSPYPAAWIFTVIGIPLCFISLSLLNNLAAGVGSMTRAMLGKFGEKNTSTMQKTGVNFPNLHP